MPEPEPTETAGPEQRPQCLLALPDVGFRRLLRALKRGVRDAGFDPVTPAALPRPALASLLFNELARAECLIADLTGRNANVLLQVGMARAMSKATFLTIRKDFLGQVPSELRPLQLLTYADTVEGYEGLSKNLTLILKDFRRSPRAISPGLGIPFFVDWDQLDPVQSENLFRELLAQMGFQRIDWYKESPSFDLAAELPKRDPDGFQYRELWFISLGRNASAETLADMARNEPEFLFRHILRDDERLDRLLRGGVETPLTLLIVLLRGDAALHDLDILQQRPHPRSVRSRYPFAVRLRVWDRAYLTSLVQRFPQIGYKYFSGAASLAKYRKTPEELYNENVDLTNRLTVTVSDLEAEKNRRLRAERDAVWKDISFSAAHKIGNPLFAIETNLQPLAKRIQENRAREALDVVAGISVSVEKSKRIIDQFKSLTRAQEIKPVATLLRPILEDACRVAVNQGIRCDINCASETTVYGDPDRIAECFDELAFNATHWLNKNVKKIMIDVVEPAAVAAAEGLDPERSYVLVHFRDNGQGVSLENKHRIFDAFVTTREHGTGLGLALVRRILEAHGGLIRETGVPGDGADFEVFLPSMAGSGSRPRRRDEMARA